MAEEVSLVHVGLRQEIMLGLSIVVSPQNENVLFCKVEMSYCSTREKPAIPLHLHGMASRPAVKASLRRKNHAALTARGRDAAECCDEGNGMAVQSAFIDLAE